MPVAGLASRLRGVSLFRGSMDQTEPFGQQDGVSVPELAGRAFAGDSAWGWRPARAGSTLLR